MNIEAVSINSTQPTKRCEPRTHCRKACHSDSRGGVLTGKGTSSALNSVTNFALCRCRREAKGLEEQHVKERCQGNKKAMRESSSPPCSTRCDALKRVKGVAPAPAEPPLVLLPGYINARVLRVLLCTFFQIKPLSAAAERKLTLRCLFVGTISGTMFH